jgi:hypothetical protein
MGQFEGLGMNVGLKAAVVTAGLLAPVWGAPALAAQMDYRLSGMASGEYAQDANPNLRSFTNVPVVFNWIGQPPGTDVGVAQIVPVSDGMLRAGNANLTLEFAFPTYVGFGEGSNDGLAGIITNEGGFVLHAVWGGPGLSGYLGDGLLASTPVTFQFMDVLYAQGPGHTYTIFTDTLSNASFAALAVPEPSDWGLMLLGFSLVGAALRGYSRLNRELDALRA